MKKEEFCYDSRDGQTKIHAVRYLPDTRQITGVVQIVHGMAEYVERYEEFAQFLTDQGYVVTGEDHLGHGKIASENGTLGYFCRQDPATVVVRDVHRLKKLTQKEYPDVPYVILGHSMGSFILRNYLYRYGEGIDGAVIVGTGMQPGVLIKASKVLAGIQSIFAGPKHVSHLLNQAAFGHYNKKISSPGTQMDWLTKDEKCVSDYIQDPLCGFIFTVNGFRTLFELIDRLHKKENLRRIPSHLPVLMASGLEDPVGEYGKGVRRAYDSMMAAGMDHMTLKLYEKDRHELLNELDRGQVMNDILSWLKEI